jgi:hypothetical protein
MLSSLDLGGHPGISGTESLLWPNNMRTVSFAAARMTLRAQWFSDNPLAA